MHGKRRCKKKIFPSLEDEITMCSGTSAGAFLATLIASGMRRGKIRIDGVFFFVVKILLPDLFSTFVLLLLQDTTSMILKMKSCGIVYGTSWQQQ